MARRRKRSRVVKSSSVTKLASDVHGSLSGHARGSPRASVRPEEDRRGEAVSDRRRDPTDVTPTVAFVTVSYGPDRDRCALLCRSIERLAPTTVGHWLLVERADLPLFRELETGSRRLLVTEDVVPVRLVRLAARRLGLPSDIFLQRRGKPIRGWLLQQLAKLAISCDIPADVIVHVDSDVTLVREFQPASVVDSEGRVRLYRLPGAIGSELPSHVKWHRSAERLLGLPPAPIPLPDYITHLVPWRRENVVALLDYLEDREGSWVRAIANAWNVSEYILYGRFVNDVLGDSAGVAATTASLCRDYWGSEHLSAQQIDALLAAMEPDEVAVSITAKAGIPAASYADQIASRWPADKQEGMPGAGGSRHGPRAASANSRSTPRR